MICQAIARRVIKKPSVFFAELLRCRCVA